MALPKWTQNDLVNELVERTGFPKGEVKHVLSALDDCVHDAITGCERITVAGVTIEPKLKAARKARMGRNPQTGEAVKIAAKPASSDVKARVSKALREKAPSAKKISAAL